MVDCLTISIVNLYIGYVLATLTDTNYMYVLNTTWGCNCYVYSKLVCVDWPNAGWKI